jgi:peptide/nickel transport system permease protein
MSEPTTNPGGTPRQPRPRRWWREYAQSRTALASLALLVAVLALALLAPWVSPQNPYDLAQLDILDSKLPPGSASTAGGRYLLGTDDQGRDMLSGIFYGLRTSLLVGTLSTVAALTLGLLLGLTAAYLGGWVDALVMRVVDLQLSFPAILLALILLAIFGQGLDKVIIALVAIQWALYAPHGARLGDGGARQATTSQATRVLGLPRWRQRAAPPAAQLPAAADRGGHRAGGPCHLAGGHAVVLRPGPADHRALAGPAHLQRLQPPDQRPATGSASYPGVALLLTILSINLVADRLRDVLNPRLRR